MNLLHLSFYSIRVLFVAGELFNYKYL